MLFDNWSELGRVVLVGTLAYLGLISMLRLSGNRTLAKMNAFDFVVTVALGSTLATILLSRDVALAEGLVAFGLLIGLQYVITWLSVRSSTVNGLVKSEPRLLLHRGKLLHRQMRTTRVVEAEILAAIRQEGIASLEDVDAVVLETDGAFSIVPTAPSSGRSTLSGVVPQPTP